jgi:PEP-CTERM motif-containing protein
MKTFHVLAVALAVSLFTQTQAFATTVAIDDMTDTLTVSIDGVNITAPGQSVGSCVGGCQNVTGFLIQPGSANNPESASINFDDFTLTTTAPPDSTLFFSKVLYLTEAGSTPGVPPIISDELTVTVRNVGVAVQIGVSLDSDFGEAGLGPCTAGISPSSNCLNLGQETGDFQDITAAALGSMQPSAIQVPGLTILVRSDATETTVPEPSTVLLLAVAPLALLAAWRTRRSRRVGVAAAALIVWLLAAVGVAPTPASAGSMELMTVSNAPICPLPISSSPCPVVINGTFVLTTDLGFVPTTTTEGPAINLNVTSSGAYAASFDTYVSAVDFGGLNQGNTVFLKDAAGDGLTLSMIGQIALTGFGSGLMAESTTLTCATAACSTLFPGGTGIDDPQNGVSGGTWTASPFAAPTPAPEPNSLTLLAAVLLAMAVARGKRQVAH